ncbi:hypothetical protein OBBRIDRAFT_839380 [Obba rivulosa]|uniref:Uncharacterized protein n=1 Tax=Obba rivulosa TaxID=1052685 RepID=A0A8E2DFF6_9APHY|nr:hypothetical protein OBBRIDRAFT_839380 [Obba rivulosa]
MALTCRTVYAYLIPFVRFWHVRIKERDADNVRHQLYTDFPRRLQFVRELSLEWTMLADNIFISVPAESDKTVRIAADILTIGRQLEVLRFPSLRDMGNQAGEYLATACKNSTSLKHLDIYHASEHDWAMIGEMEAPLRTLCVRTYMPMLFSAENFVFPDLARFASTLEVLTLEAGSGILFRPPSRRCSSLHTLSLSHARSVHLSSLATLFPNVRVLRIQDIGLSADAGVVSQGGVWPRLDTITSDIRSLSALGWRNHVARLNIICRNIGQRDFPWLVWYLGLVSPTTFSITFEFIDNVDWLKYVTAVRDRCTTLSNLIVYVHLNTELIRQDAPSKLFQAVCNLFPSTTHLVLRVKWYTCVIGMNKSLSTRIRQMWSSNSGSKYIGRLTEKTDVRKLILTIAQHLPRLRFVFVEIVSEGDLYWTIEREQKGKLSARELTPMVGQSVVKERSLTSPF